MQKRFKLLYSDSRFIKRNAIFICFFTKILSNFDNIAQFTNNNRENSI